MVVWSKVVPRKPDSFADEGCGGYSQPQVYFIYWPSSVVRVLKSRGKLRQILKKGLGMSASSPHEPAEPDLPSPLKSETSEKPEEEIDFETFYLKQVTTEFADDLDKLRNASDFTEKSMPVLIDALKGTARMYSDKEKADVMGAGR
ncbi:MAG: hypothetical protein Q9204_002953 [Flavoplaca sp. TL-2023a]